MTWEAVAAEHIDNPTGQRHRMVLLSSRELSCLDCQRKLILPRDLNGPSPSPAPFRGFDRSDARPMPAGWKARVAAELRARRDARTDLEAGKP